MGHYKINSLGRISQYRVWTEQELFGTSFSRRNRIRRELLPMLQHWAGNALFILNLSHALLQSVLNTLRAEITTQ